MAPPTMPKRFSPLFLALVACLLVWLVAVWRAETPPASQTVITEKAAAASKPAAVREKSASTPRLTSVASGRLRRPLVGVSDLSLPKRVDLGWGKSVPEPVFEEFRRWTEHFSAEGAEADLQKGIEMARARREEMVD